MVHSKRSSRRCGGTLGSILNQAIVPFSLLGLQQTYKKKSKKTKSGGKSHRRRKHTRRH